MFTTRRHWSYSSLNTYLRCPLQYYLERVLKLPKPTTSGGLILGSAVHAALADYHLSLQKGQAASIDKVQRVFAAHWTLREAERPIQYKAGENRIILLATGIALLEGTSTVRHRRRRATTTRRVQVQEPQELRELFLNALQAAIEMNSSSP